MANALPDDKVYLLISTVGTNVDRLRQGINALRQLHDRWEHGGDTCINLIAQLAALKSCLGKVHDWLNYAISDLHPQLLSDLEVLMASCSLLVRHTDRLIQGLRQPDHDAVDCAIKLKYAIGSRTMERIREAALRQTDAMSLLHAACQW
jgi:guanine nucleotide-binding protein G(i) subunit alpha